MYVREGAVKVLRKVEREKFLKEEWPRVLARIERLELDVSDLLRKGAKA
jgi:GntR family transcriptional regulator